MYIELIYNYLDIDMHRFFIFDNQEQPTERIIPTDDLFHQLTKVLRIRANEEFMCIYKNLELKCILDGNEIKVIEHTEFEINKDRKITLIQALPKNKKVSLILQKATELDVDEIILWESKRSTSKLEDFSKKEERLNKIIVEACEQSRRNDIPSIKFASTIEELNINESTIVLYENEKELTIKESINNIEKDIIIVVGPEGGFEVSEIAYFTNNNAKISTLGKNILRTETASIAALAIVNYELR